MPRSALPLLLSCSADGAQRFPGLVPWTAEQAEGAADWLPRIVGQRWRDSAGLPAGVLREIALELGLPSEPDRPFVERPTAAQQLDAVLVRLARGRGAIDVAVGEALARLSEGDRVLRLGFSCLGDYARERLGMAPRTLRERARLERRLAALPRLRAALRAGRLSYEQAKLVARVASAGTEAAWIARAEGLTVLSLRRVVTEWEDDGAGRLVAPQARCQRIFRSGPPSGRLFEVPQSDRAVCRRGSEAPERIAAGEPGAGWKMCAPSRGLGRKMCAPSWRSPLPWLRRRQVRAPESTATLLWMAIEAARGRFGRGLSKAAALALIAAHFIGVWRPTLSPPKTVAQRVLERDGGRCQVPGCSRQAVHAHHVRYRSQGGSDAEENEVGLCAAHHLRAVHQGWLSVTGKAPHELVWRLGVRSSGALLEYRSGPDGPVRV